MIKLIEMEWIEHHVKSNYGCVFSKNNITNNKLLQQLYNKPFYPRVSKLT